MTNPTEPGAASVSEHPLRERAARIIDPAAWILREQSLELAEEPALRTRAEKMAADEVRVSLRKADDILALTTPARPSGELMRAREAAAAYYEPHDPQLAKIIRDGANGKITGLVEHFAAFERRILAAAPALTPVKSSGEMEVRND